MAKSKSTRSDVSKKIRDDWGTIRHFCKKNSIHYQSLLNALVGKRYYETVANKLVELGYINNADDLKRAA